MCFELLPESNTTVSNADYKADFSDGRVMASRHAGHHEPRGWPRISQPPHAPRPRPPPADQWEDSGRPGAGPPPARHVHALQVQVVQPSSGGAAVASGGLRPIDCQIPVGGNGALRRQTRSYGVISGAMTTRGTYLAPKRAGPTN